ncbi:PD-(D/E)XK nuclease family protein [Coleofasciculus sp. G2-EDA-02]|uniref:PD-(D/E)XK nuclease family protein n=1 Tax=Coleofasciculus sp. G2-EDA-02 TaxID=3069529 RepID=UPI0032F26C0B
MWSFSAAKTFKKCQRQWYYKNCLANWKAKDIHRHKAYLLSKLQSISSWRGSIVDSVISEVIVPTLKAKGTPSLTVAQQRAKELFDRQLKFARQHPLHQQGLSPSQVGSDFAVFHCMEYGGKIPETEIKKAKAEIDQALANLFNMPEVWSELKTAQYLVTQRALSFSHTGETVRAVPDLIAFYRNKPPLIIDWKVHFSGVYRALNQLGIYALALTRGKPHKDFPKLSKWEVTDLQLLEIQLLTNKIRRYQLDEVRIAEIDNFMAESISAMQLIVGEAKKSTLAPMEFLTASSPETCQFCNYQSICWESA